MKVVVGNPIKVPTHETPPEDVVEKYHRLYFKELRDLFDRHKGDVDGFQDSVLIYPDFGEEVDPSRS